MFDVGDDSDDDIPGLRVSDLRPEAQSLTNRISISEEATPERFVDDDRPGRVRAIARLDHSAGTQRYSHRLEVLWRNRIPHRASGSAAFCARDALDLDAVAV